MADRTIGTFGLISLLKVPIRTFSIKIDAKVPILTRFFENKWGIPHLFLSFGSKGTMILQINWYLSKVF